MDEFTIALNSLLWSAANTDYHYLGDALRHYLHLAEDKHLETFYPSAEFCAKWLAKHLKRKDVIEIFNEYFDEHIPSHIRGIQSNEANYECQL